MRIHQDARVVFVVLPFSSFLIIIYGFGPPLHVGLRRGRWERVPNSTRPNSRRGGRQGLVARRVIDGQALVCSRKGHGPPQTSPGPVPKRLGG